MYCNNLQLGCLVWVWYLVSIKIILRHLVMSQMGAQRRNAVSDWCIMDKCGVDRWQNFSWGHSEVGDSSRCGRWSPQCHQNSKAATNWIVEYHSFPSAQFNTDHLYSLMEVRRLLIKLRLKIVYACREVRTHWYYKPSLICPARKWSWVQLKLFRSKNWNLLERHQSICQLGGDGWMRAGSSLFLLVS
jgi:hypothetical protein